MKRFFAFAIVIFSTHISFSQNGFEPGYFIDASGNRSEVFIKTSDLNVLQDPDGMISYKTTADSEPEQIATATLSELSLGKDTKYKRFNVSLDDTDTGRDDNTERYGRYLDASVFLNVLIEGPASLYSYERNKGLKFFYLIKGKMEAPAQLLYKRYRQGSVMRENFEYRQVLSKELACEGDSFDKFKNLKYQADELKVIFTGYNACHGGDQVSYANSRKPSPKLGYTVFAGVRFNGYDYDNGSGDPIYNPNPEAVSSVGFGAGGEVELLLPSRKWSLFLQLSARNNKAEMESDRVLNELGTMSAHDTYTYDAITIEAVVGARYYLLNRNSNNIYLDAGAGMALNTGKLKTGGTFYDSGTSYPIGEGELSAKSESFFGVAGLGYVFEKKYGIELRVGTPRLIIDQFSKSLTGSSAGINLRYSF